MFRKLFLATLILFLPTVALTGCGTDEPENPSQVSPDNPNAPNEHKEKKVTIKADGTTSDGTFFQRIDDDTFMLNYVKYCIVDDHVEVCGYDKDEIEHSLNGQVEIYSTIEIDNKTYYVKAIGDYAFQNCTSLNEISIPYTVTSIGSYAFFKCTSLVRVNIPMGVTEIKMCAFYECSLLSNIDIPKSVKKIGRQAFGYCFSLEEINIPGSVNIIGDFAFDSCTSIKRVNIEEGVKKIENRSFSLCSSLKEINIPGSVSIINEEAFFGCPSLRHVDIPEGVKEIRYSAFSNCKNLISISLPSTLERFNYVDENISFPYRSNINDYYFKYIYMKGHNPPELEIISGAIKTSFMNAGIHIFVPQAAIQKYVNSIWSNIRIKWDDNNVTIIGVDTETFDFKEYLKKQGVYE